MGNRDSIPVVSQVKSAVQYASGDSAGALHTQQNFAYNNTFPVISQIASAGYAIGGDLDKAEDLQVKFAKDMERVISTIPVAGHIEGGIYYGLGDKKKGEEAMKAASRSTGVAIGGVGGFLAGGPVGAAAGGIAGGALADGIITGSDILAKGKENATDSGYIAAGKQIKDAIDGKTKIKVDEAFDMALLPVADGVGGYVSGNIAGKVIGKLKPGEVVAPGVEGSKSGPLKPALETDSVIGKGSNTVNLDQKALNNRANQLNPNHAKSGPGREAGYRGMGTKADLDNRANQMNPNNEAYIASRQQNSANPVPAVTLNANANPGQDQLQKAQADDAAALKTGSAVKALKAAGSAAATTGGFLVNTFGGVWQFIMAVTSIVILVLSILVSAATCILKRRRRSARRDDETPIIPTGPDEGPETPIVMQTMHQLKSQSKTCQADKWTFDLNRSETS